ncbi:MAG: cytochrome P460 family protein, partial [Bdellovibrionota bacterium]
DKAWLALKQGGKKYPDGAVFAKIGLKTASDPSFVSSVVPSGAKRIQYMIRKAKLHAATGGWGYALFDADGKTFPGEPKVAQLACYACHQIVTGKNYVFSEIAAISLKGGKGSVHASLPTLEFEEIPSSALPAKIREIIAPDFSSVSSIKGNLRKNIFPGTMDEIRIYLSQEATIRKRPALLFNEDGTAFSLVYPIFENKCPTSGAPTLHSFTKGSKDAPEATKLTFCN